MSTIDPNAPQPVQQPQPASPSEAAAAAGTTTDGMWSEYVPPEIGEPLELLQQAGEFVIVSASIRDGVKTKHGEKSAFDITVQTIQPGATRLVSGFASGIVAQIRMANADDLPAVARIVETPTPRGTTHTLGLVSKLDPAADLAAVARSLPTPIAPLPAPQAA